MVDVLLVGGGVASAACASELRARGFEGSVVLAGRELDPPYERPPCSKDYLRGAVEREAIALELPDGALIISVLRNGGGFVPNQDTVIEAGDEVLLVLDPGLEDVITPQFTRSLPGG